jgi:hypothetical protein
MIRIGNDGSIPIANSAHLGLKPQLSATVTVLPKIFNLWKDDAPPLNEILRNGAEIEKKALSETPFSLFLLVRC